MRITPIFAADPDTSAGYWYRMHLPLKELRNEVKISSRSDDLKVIFGCWNDLNARVYQGRYILDFDDLVWDVPYGKLCEFAPLLKVIQGATAITVASPLLADEFKRLPKCPPVHYCRTGLDPADYPEVPEPTNPVVAWRGSRGWYRAMSWWRPHLPDETTVLQGLPWLDYKRMLKTFDRTLEFCPSYPSSFEACKSSVKLLQALMQGVPVIASALPPYGKVAEAAGQITVDDPLELNRKVEQMLMDDVTRHEIARRGWGYVMDNWQIKDTAHDFLEVWSKYV